VTAADKYKIQYLDAAYVDRLGRQIAASLREGVPVACPYQPQNGTRYELVLTPMFAVSEWPSQYPVSADYPREHSVTIAIVNDGYRRAITLPILQPGFWLHESYLQEKLGVSEGDALALLALFELVSGS
jgi:hypothetical protein